MINGLLKKMMMVHTKWFIMKQILGSVTINNPNWNFVTGDKASLYKLARQGYAIDNGKPDSTQQIQISLYILSFLH